MHINKQGSIRIFEEIKQVVQVPIKFIHVTRNPFDNISTMLLRATDTRDAVREQEVKVSKGLLCVLHQLPSARSSCSLFFILRKRRTNSKIGLVI